MPQKLKNKYQYISLAFRYSSYFLMPHSKHRCPKRPWKLPSTDGIDLREDAEDLFSPDRL